MISAQMSRGRRGMRTCNCLLRSPPARKWGQRTEAPPATQPPMSTTASAARTASSLPGAAGLGGTFGIEALEGGLGGVIDEAHALGDGPVAGLLGDQAVHLLGATAVRRVPLGCRSHPEDVPGRPRVGGEGEHTPAG